MRPKQILFASYVRLTQSRSALALKATYFNVDQRCICHSTPLLHLLSEIFTHSSISYYRMNLIICPTLAIARLL